MCIIIIYSGCFAQPPRAGGKKAHSDQRKQKCEHILNQIFEQTSKKNTKKRPRPKFVTISARAFFTSGKGARRAPRCPQERRKRGPGAAQNAPRTSQERPKSAQERQETTQERQDAPKSGPRAAQERPQSAQERPKSAQERPKSAPRAAKRAPRGPQEGAKSVPSGSQEGPKSSPRGKLGFYEKPTFY